MKFNIFYLTLLLFMTVNLFSQTVEKGYIIEIEGSKIYVDYTIKDVKVGDRLRVMSKPKVIIHPVTKKEIIKEGELIAILEITETQNDYSIADRIFPSNAINKLSVGEKVLLPDNTGDKVLSQNGKINVAIADATVNDVVGIGYFGNYVADLLMAEMLTCDKIRLIDRSMLKTQIDESNLSEAGYINSENSLVKGQIAGVQNMIFVTMQRPDVANITTGIPIKTIITTAGQLSNIAGVPSGVTNGLETGGALTSNVKTARLKAAVSLTARVIDVQTGELLFMCTGTGNAEGESQLQLEEGALGGLQINGGVEGFKQTVTGKAIVLAYRKIGNSLKSYFNGETNEKVIKSGFLDTEMEYRKGYIYMGVNKLSKNDIKEAFSENPKLYFDYKRGKNQKAWGSLMMWGGVLWLCAALPTYYSTKDLIFQNCVKLDPVFHVATLSSAVFGISGCILRSSGKQKIKNSIKSYNENFRKTSFKSEFNVGLTSNGVTLSLTF